MYDYLYSGLGVQRNEKRNLVLTAVAILIALIMMLPVGAQLTLNHSQKTMTYTWGSEIVRFQGVNAAVGFGENTYPVSWKIYRSVQAGTTTGTDTEGFSSLQPIPENFSNYQTVRITNDQQNTAGILLWNKDVKVAETYSFTSQGVDSSISVTNLNHYNETFIAVFSIQQKSDPISIVSGFTYSNIFHGPGVANSIYAVPSSSWGIRQGNLSMTWINEIPIFNGGLLYSGQNSIITSLTFGPVSLVPNETYSIDPIISPDSSTPPHGGGGGGSGGTTSVGVYFSHLNVMEANGITFGTGSVIDGDELIQFSVDYSATSSTAFNVFFVGISSSGANVQFSTPVSTSGSETGTVTMRVPAIPGFYTGFTVRAGSNAIVYSDPVLSENVFVRTMGPTGPSNDLTCYPDSVASAALYSTTTDQIVQNVAETVIIPDDNISQQSPVKLSFSTIYSNASRTMGVWNVSQEFRWTGNSLGYSPSNGAYATLKKELDQVQTESGPSAGDIVGAMWNAAALALGFASVSVAFPWDVIAAGASAALSLAALIGQFLLSNANVYKNSFNNVVWDNQSGNNNDPDLNIYYPILGPGWMMDPVSGNYYIYPDQCLSYIFNSNITMTLGSAPSLNLNYFVYTSTIYAMPVDGVNGTFYAPNSGDGTPPFYATTVSLPIYMSQEPELSHINPYFLIS